MDKTKEKAKEAVLRSLGMILTGNDPTRVLALGKTRASILCVFTASPSNKTATTLF